MPPANTAASPVAHPYHPVMALRRAFFAWQFAAAAVLPIWLFIGYAVSGSPASGLLGVVLAAPVVALVELGLALLFSARAGIRREKALDAPALAVLTAFQVGVIGFGLFGPASAWFGVLAAIAAVGGFWVGGRLLARDVQLRMRQTMAGFPPPQPRSRAPIDAGEYIVIKPAAR